MPRRRASRKRKLPLPPQEILNNPGRFLPKDVKAPPAVSQSEEVVRAIKFIADRDENDCAAARHTRH